jgi:hypothetical protein
MVTITASLGTYRFAAFIGQIRWGVRGGFLSLIGGLSAYTYLASGLPGSQDLIGSSGAFGILLVTVLGCVTGILVAWAWRYLQVGSKFEN